MPTKNPANYITPLLMNDLVGRLLHLPALKNKTREILLVYGHNFSLERLWGLAQELNQYGAINMPDLPGFGGMESFYKIGQKPTIDNLADYLAAFVKMRYSHKKVTITGLGFGFVVITRMLQRHPGLAKRVDMLVSVRGFTHKDDFSLSKTKQFLCLRAARLMARQLPALFIKNVYLRPLKRRYTQDLRTAMQTYAESLVLNNCDRRVELPAWHISATDEPYFDNQIVEQHMNVIFSNVYTAEAPLANYAAGGNNRWTAAVLMPADLRKVLVD